MTVGRGEEAVGGVDLVASSSAIEVERCRREACDGSCDNGALWVPAASESCRSAGMTCQQALE